MRRKWTIALVLVPIGMYACGTDLSILPDLSDGGSDGSADADAATATGDSASSADAGPTCTPKTCGEIGAQCGSAPNGCGGALADCGVCPASELCGAGGRNRCGDGGCVPATSCAGRCGTISNGCGGTVACGGCTGANYCDGNSGTCAMCSVFSPVCGSISEVTCPTGLPGNYKAYACDQAPDTTKGCVHCPNGSGGGLIFCCP